MQMLIWITYFEIVIGEMCRVMTFDGIYRCNTIHHEKINIYPYDKNVLIENFIDNKNKPIDYCKDCDVHVNLS